MPRAATLAILSLLLFLAPLRVEADPAPAKLIPALGWDVKNQGGFAVSIASDKTGAIWVGTEGNGLWKYDPAKKAWSQFTTKDGLGDDCVYALAVDGQNRLWAGHLNHGVSVYNGEKWQNYGLLDGPLGDRVFAIAVSPKDGSVWVATDMGLARYSDASKDWDYYTRASGLPSDQIQAIAFDLAGRLYAGTQCDGIAVGSADDDYKKWRVVSAAVPDVNIRANVQPPDKVTIRAILPLPDQPPLFAAYDGAAGGLLTLDNAPPFKPTASGTGAAAAAPELPVPASAPVLGDAKALSAQLAKLTLQIAPGEAFYLADDWRTRGDWIGRYGSGFVKLCGISQIGDQDYPLQSGYAVTLGLGPHHQTDAPDPVWCHDDETSNDIRSLYDPLLGLRRDAEENDRSDDSKPYPDSYDGPDL